MDKKFDQVEIDKIHEYFSSNSSELEDFVAAIRGRLLERDFVFETRKNLILPPAKKPLPFYRFRQYQYVEKPIEEVFEFFSDAKNLERITPSQLSFRIDSQSTDEIQEGTEFIYKLKIHGFPAKWKTIITNWDPPFQFVDYQEFGPYKVWFHNHMFIPTKNGTLLVDEVKFILPFQWFTRHFIAWFIKKDVKNIFEHRYKYIEEFYK